MLQGSDLKSTCSLFFDDENGGFSLKGDLVLSSCQMLCDHFSIAQQKISSAPKDYSFSISGQEITQMDTAGAWLLLSWKKQLGSMGNTVTLHHFKPLFRNLIKRVEKAYPDQQRDVPQSLTSSPLRNLVLKMGDATITAYEKACALTTFLGEIILTLVHLPASRHRVRFISFIAQLEQVGINALPIVGLISFLIGIVLTFQGADQLKRLGAEAYTVNLVGISVLREIGVLLTAIVVAGRSGSAFTAQIGAMQLNQEIDALQTMGLNPLILLVLPRVFALVLMLPFLTFFADMMGLFGSALMSHLTLGVPFPLFFYRLKGALTPWTFWIGIIKAPVFAFTISLVGCFEGFAVRGGSESVGRQTTQSVVESIFLVIVMDALFSILFTVLGI